MHPFLTRIFHTDRDEEAAKPDGVPPAFGRPQGRLPLVAALKERDERATPNLTVTTFYLRLSQALVLPKSQCESNAGSTLASRSPQ